MEPKKKPIIDKIVNVFQRFEQVIVMSVSIIIGLIIIISLIRTVENFYDLFVLDVATPTEITFEDYQQVFGKIMTLIISLEFMVSLLKVLKTHKIKSLVQDVVLITALAIARKLIIFDYEHQDFTSVLALAGLLVAIGIFYFLIVYDRFKPSKSANKVQE